MEKNRIIENKLIDSINGVLEPMGFKYYKSRNRYKKTVDNNTTLFFNLVFNRHMYSFNINIFVEARYQDLEKGWMDLNSNFKPYKKGDLGIGSLLHFLFPDNAFPFMEYNFSYNDDETINCGKINKITRWVEEYAIPYYDVLCNPELNIADQIRRDKQGLLYNYENIVPVMYCVWKHDKKAALDYLEEKRLRLLGRVKSEEWELLERFKNGERFGKQNPFNALSYDEFITFEKRFKEWVGKRV